MVAADQVEQKFFVDRIPRIELSQQGYGHQFVPPAFGISGPNSGVFDPRRV
jgi:hypothetical protein